MFLLTWEERRHPSHFTSILCLYLTANYHEDDKEPHGRLCLLRIRSVCAMRTLDSTNSQQQRNEARRSCIRILSNQDMPSRGRSNMSLMCWHRGGMASPRFAKSSSIFSRCSIASHVLRPKRKRHV